MPLNRQNNGVEECADSVSPMMALNPPRKSSGKNYTGFSPKEADYLPY